MLHILNNNLVLAECQYLLSMFLKKMELYEKSCFIFSIMKKKKKNTN